MESENRIEGPTTFVEMIKNIQGLAHNICQYWGHRFDVDELVNEAWMRSKDRDHTDPPLIMRAAKMDMIDYIRKVVGRKSYYLKGKKIPATKRINFITNCDSFKEEEGNNGHSILEKVYHDKSFDEVDNKELISVILSKLFSRQAEIIVNYYLEERNLTESSEMIGVGQSRGSTFLKQSRKECLDILKQLDLDQQSVIGS